METPAEDPQTFTRGGIAFGAEGEAVDIAVDDIEDEDAAPMTFTDANNYAPIFNVDFAGTRNVLMGQTEAQQCDAGPGGQDFAASQKAIQ
ncbi:unnamed protein product, partial [Amoebophrya sp. A25]|eukprot:GSA25T00005826001.1